MPTAKPIPRELVRGPFTTLRAAEFGFSKDALMGRRFHRIFHGVYVMADQEITNEIRIRGALLALPSDAVLSHVTALRWLGVEVGRDRPLHFSVNSTGQTSLSGVVLHRRRGDISASYVRGIRVLGPDRSFVDAATQLGYVELIRAGDWLVRLGLTTPGRLNAYAQDRHLDGVRRARRAAPHVRSRVDSVMETDVRLLMRFARLPEPEVNVDIFDDDGTFLARGDLVYRLFWIIVEYDGWHHERDPRQRQRDHLRRERLESAGWRVIVITVEDMRQPSGVITRVDAALRHAGYHGPAPVMSDSWKRWFNAA